MGSIIAISGTTMAISENVFSKAPVMPGVCKAHVSGYFRDLVIEARVSATPTRVTYDYQMDALHIDRYEG